MSVELKVIEAQRTCKFKDMTVGRWYMNATGPRNNNLYTRIDDNLFCLCMNEGCVPLFPKLIKYMSDNDYVMVALSGHITAEHC
jgi:hypothetical protein